MRIGLSRGYHYPVTCSFSRFWNCRIDLNEIRDIFPQRPMRKVLVLLHDLVEDSRFPKHRERLDIG